MVATVVPLSVDTAVGAVGVPVKAGLVKDLFVNISVPSKVAKVPVAGKVTLVATVVVNVVAKAPDVVRLPPKVMLFPVLSTPVPPCTGKITPLIFASVTELSAILTVVMAPLAITGAAAVLPVPPKSPAN